jgi:arabinogalactan oligomer/maltooligosaccharide transport system permease protein
MVSAARPRTGLSGKVRTGAPDECADARKVRFGVGGRRRRSVGASVALHGTLVTASLIAVFPVAWVVLTSIKPRSGWQSTELKLFVEPTLVNYTHVLTETKFLRWFANSVAIATLTTIVGLFLAATAAYALSRMRFPGHRPLLTGFLVTQMFPVAILIVPIYNIMAALHLLDSYGGLVLAYCTVAVPFCAWMLKGYFDTIPTDLDEAGRMDGLSPFGVFWRVIVPLSRPGLAVTAFYSFLTAWGEVAYATTFMVGEQNYTLAVGIQQFVGQFKAEWGLLTAASVLITVPVAIVFFLAQKHLVTGLTAGGTKS